MSDYRGLSFLKLTACVIVIYFSPTCVMIFESLLDNFFIRKTLEREKIE